MNSNHVIVNQADMPGREILRLYAEGFRLVCRYCKVEFSTIPDTLAPGEMPVSVSCPKNINHMHLVNDPASAMQSVRSGMRIRAGVTK
jgi:hypothetical protein